MQYYWILVIIPKTLKLGWSQKRSFNQKKYDVLIRKFLSLSIFLSCLSVPKKEINYKTMKKKWGGSRILDWVLTFVVSCYLFLIFYCCCCSCNFFVCLLSKLFFHFVQEKKKEHKTYLFPFSLRWESFYYQTLTSREDSGRPIYLKRRRWIMLPKQNNAQKSEDKLNIPLNYVYLKK